MDNPDEIRRLRRISAFDRWREACMKVEDKIEWETKGGGKIMSRGLVVAVDNREIEFLTLKRLGGKPLVRVLYSGRGRAYKDEDIVPPGRPAVTEIDDVCLDILSIEIEDPERDDFLPHIFDSIEELILEDFVQNVDFPGKGGDD